MKKKKWITDVISKEEVEKWKPGNVVLISAPMGAGKYSGSVVKTKI